MSTVDPNRAHARHNKRFPGHRIARLVSLIIVGAVSFAVAGGAAVYADLNGSLNKVNIDKLLGTKPTEQATTSPIRSTGDPYAGHAVNLLIIGSDSRGGANAAVGGSTTAQVQGARSDTLMILHVSADRTRMEAVSIPRDTMVVIPSCEYVYKGSTHTIAQAGRRDLFNSAFTYGQGPGGDVASGAACSIRTVQQISNIPIDGFIVVDFAGFANIVNAIGGVCVNTFDFGITKNINDKFDGLYMPAGQSCINGDTALKLARAREGFGSAGLTDGSDLFRIKIQHVLFQNIITKVLGMNILTNFPKLYNFAGQLANSLTTNISSLEKLAGFAYSVRAIPTSHINFETVPIVSDPSNRNRVILSQPAAGTMFARLATDTPLANPTASTAPSTGAPSGVTRPKQ